MAPLQLWRRLHAPGLEGVAGQPSAFQLITPVDGLG
jgi:hypothetical protein